MALYESVWIARQDISTTQVEALTEQFSEIIKNNGGEVKSLEQWGLRSLAYKIKKNRKGHYVMFNIDAPAAAVAEMERNMRLNEDVLRCLTLRVEALQDGQSVMLQQRSERGDRPERGDRGDRGDRGPRGDRGDRGDRGPRNYDRGDSNESRSEGDVA
ncbi:30S ribosomal protein S6 [Oceanibaculum indicum]|uniref:Small ribosomal subunit protein bS6 n=2 Tax=Oceanibaculum indicum TaxID=526216 RepID=K2JRX0_9PROT|nr:30S ribosomal protein S6 [Oceanibaculum indicum]EKE78183.1 30S ribosomal protein S6 [Oceanibaculum indicum P24]RKQ73632.1 small subunit ribosomal protein S6 [Oceanibaculum indicum]